MANTQGSSSWLLRFTFFTMFIATPMIIGLYRFDANYVIYYSAPQESGKEETQNDEVADYQSLQNAATVLKNYWLYFRAIANQTKFKKQMKTIDDGYATSNSFIQSMIDISENRRGAELKRMSLFVRKEIENLQNPKDCDTANLLVANMNIQRCGFGCTLHTVVRYLLVAFMAKRTLILKSEGWTYAEEGWEYAFLPMSTCRFDGDIKELPVLKDRNRHHRVLLLTRSSQKWIHWSIPSDLKLALAKIHGDPYAWWIGQFTSYATRLQPWLEKEIQNRSAEISFDENMAGVQVRWGDKIDTEAKKFEVEEYMLFVETWFKQLELQGKTVNKTVYLASEEGEVWDQMRRKYPSYKFIGLGPATWKPRPQHRYKHEGLISVITDVYLLSRCAYLVCTMSSSVCRSAYELMMNYHSDASNRVQKIDALYRFKQIDTQPWKAVMDHEAINKEEVSFKKGDEVLVKLDPFLPFNDGFLRGIHNKTNQEGKFPIFKLKKVVSTYTKEAFKREWKSKVQV